VSWNNPQECFHCHCCCLMCQLCRASLIAVVLDYNSFERARMFWINISRTELTFAS
jgi:hypothetical protein